MILLYLKCTNNIEIIKDIQLDNCIYHNKKAILEINDEILKRDYAELADDFNAWWNKNIENKGWEKAIYLLILIQMRLYWLNK